MSDDQMVKALEAMSGENTVTIAGRAYLADTAERANWKISLVGK